MVNSSKCMSVANIEISSWKGHLVFPREKHVAALCKVQSKMVNS